MDRPEDLIKLRDLDKNIWNVDTLDVLSSGADDNALRRLASGWHADSVDWISGSEADKLLGQWGAGRQRILEVWWD